jgi:fructan beta-fructosidase
VTNESYRPRFHVTPARNWMNDPNGLVFVGGLAHVFFQYNPEGAEWGNMSWGHAASPDLVTWTEHPVALPYGAGEQVFSGSVVVDHGNTSGFGDRAGAGAEAAPPLVAVYTSVDGDGRQTQALATSVDSGRTWHQYTGNPVLDRGSREFRDPKVFRAADRHGRERWVMVAVEAVDRQVLVYSSDDLRSWTHESTFGPIGPDGVVWECPDLFPLDVDGDPEGRRWVLLLSFNPVGDGVDADDAADGSSMVAVIGDFDGHRFTPDDGDRWDRLDHGRDFYAGVTFDNEPDGRRIMLGWMGNWRYQAVIPTHPWRGAMSLPRELELRTIDGVVRLVQSPVVEVEPLDSAELVDLPTPTPIEGRRRMATGRHFALDLEWQVHDATEVGIDLLVGDGDAVRLAYDVGRRELRLDRTRSGVVDFHADFPSISRVGVPLRDGRLRLQVSVDGCLVEVFADTGAVTISCQVFPDPDATDSVVFADGAATVSIRRRLSQLRLAVGQRS